jgi:uncharacterized protein YutE (UPF0331/DUF86 family)
MPKFDSAVEQHVLEELRPRYERRGYTFTVHPDRTTLPEFMRDYVPDAIATSDHDNIAIEVKGSTLPGEGHSVERLRNIFVGHDNWKLTVIYGGADPERRVSIPSAHSGAFRDGINSIEELIRTGQNNAAIVMTFALLEAAVPLIDKSGSRRPQMPGTVIQSLAMNGTISVELEKQLRTLVSLRNRIVHGDLSIKANATEAKLLLDLVKEVLAAKAD